MGSLSSNGVAIKEDNVGLSTLQQQQQANSQLLNTDRDNENKSKSPYQTNISATTAGNVISDFEFLINWFVWNRSNFDVIVDYDFFGIFRVDENGNEIEVEPPFTGELTIFPNFPIQYDGQITRLLITTAGANISLNGERKYD